MYGVVNLRRVDTEPGANTAFAPPVGFEGDYRRYLANRYRNDPGARQHIFCAARWMKRNKLDPPVFLGRFAKEAQELLSKFDFTK